MRKVLVLVVGLAILASVAKTAPASVGSPATMATQIAATVVGHRPWVVARYYYPPVYYPQVVVPAPVAVPASVVVPRAVYYGPRYYRRFVFPPVVVPDPYVSYGVIY